MTFDSATHHRRSLRLRDYDYAQAGAYFVTVCTQNRACLFGEVADGQMTMNDAGRMVERWFEQLPDKFPDIECDAFVCMPNHVHLVIAIHPHADNSVGADPCVGPADPRVCPEGGDGSNKGAHAGAPLRNAVSRDVGLSAVVQWFKTMTTNEYMRGVKSRGWPAFTDRLWQRNYYEHIVRSEESLTRIREYIRDNPAKWSLDRENPANVRLAATKTEQEDSHDRKQPETAR